MAGGVLSRRSWTRRAAPAVVGITLLVVLIVVARSERTPGPDVPEPPTSPAPPPVGEAPPAREVPTSELAWAPVEIGGGGFVTGLVIGSGDEMYVRTDVGGAYRRKGDSWVQMLRADAVPQPQSSDYSVAAIAVSPEDPRTVYLAAGSSDTRRSGRVLASRDGGRTWAASRQRWVIDGNGRCRQQGERLAVDPADASTVWYVADGGLWRSTDGGGRWRQAADSAAVDGTEQPLDGCALLLLDEDGPFDEQGRTRGIWLGTDRGVYHSSDGGRSWTRVAPAAGRIQELERDPASDLLIVTAERVSRLDPSDRSVTDITPPMAKEGSLREVAVDPTDPRHVVVSEAGMRDGHLFRSVDAGRNWEELDVAISVRPAGPAWPEMTTLDSWMSVGALAFDSTGELWLAEGMGVWRTRDLADAEVTWLFESAGIEELVSNDVLKVPGGPLLTAHWDRGLFIHPANQEAVPLVPGFNSAWSIVGTPADPDVLAVIINNHQRPDRQTDGDQQSAISIDGGRTWHRMRSLTDGVHPSELKFGNIAISSSDPTLFVWMPSEGGRIHRSTDQGATWSAAARQPWSDDYHHAHHLHRRVLTSDPDDGMTFYVMSQVGADGGLFVSTDGGETWRRRESTGLPRYDKQWNATLRAAGDGVLFFSPGPFRDNEHPLYRSRDGGRTWTGLTSTAGTEKFGLGAEVDGIPTLWVYRVDGSGGTIERSTDLGDSFEDVARYPLDRYDDVAVVEGDPEDPEVVYVGYRGTGVVKRARAAPPASTGG